jgi:5-hydroxyisourate hydrolase
VTISTHVLDAAKGEPARGMNVSLDQFVDDSWSSLGGGVTNDDGRCPELTEGLALTEGYYRIRFETGDWFEARQTQTFYPVVELTFAVSDAAAHYHVPLLLSPFAYSTYRGS